MKKKTILIIGIVLLVILILVGGYFLFFKDKININSNNNQNNEEATEKESDIVLSKEFNFNVDSMGYLQIVADIILKEALTSDEVLNIEIKAYDKDDNLLHSYIASSRYFDINGYSEIHLGFDDNLSEDLNKINYLTTNITVEARETDARYDYEFVVNIHPEVVNFLTLYRVYMDLSDYYYTYSGLAVIEYEDGSKVMDRISYLTDENYIGVSFENDFSTKDGSNISKVSVYRIGNMREI